MKLRNKIVALFLTVACAFGLAVAGNATKVNAEAQTYSYAFTSKQFSSNSTVTLNGVKWTLAGTGGNYWGHDGTKGNQFGSKKAPYKSMTLTSEEFTGVSRVSINTSGASGLESKLTVLVGETTIGTYSLTDSPATMSFDANALNGQVCFSYVSTTAKAIYIKSIEVVHGVGAVEKTDAEKVAEAAEALTLDVTSKYSSFELPTIGKNGANITWESNNAAITAEGSSANVVRPTEDTVVTLTATITVGEEVETKTFEVTVKGFSRTVVNSPVAGTYYKLAVTQQTTKKDLFLTGATDGVDYRLAGSEDASKGALVYLEEVEGGYYLVCLANGVKSYINVIPSGSHINANFQSAGSSVWTYSTKYNTLTTTVSGTEYYLGAYKNYNNFQASKSSFLDGGSSTSFACYFVELTDAELEELNALKVKVGYQVGTKDEAKALRLVAELNLTAEDLETFESTIAFRVTHNGKADERVVTTLYSSVNPMNDEAELTGAYYAVLTYVNVPAGEYLVEVLVDGEVAATVTATVA